MFLVAKRPIVEALRDKAQEIEERSPRFRVLAARVFRYPVRLQRVAIHIQEYRTMNLLEKFVLRAAAEVSPAPSLEEVAEALGVDLVFIKNTFDDLVELNRITRTQNSLHLTAEGSKSLSSEKLPKPVDEQVWYLIQDRVRDTASFSRHPPDHIDEALENLDSYVNKDLSQFSPFTFNIVELQSRLQDLGMEEHNPGADRFVTQLAPIWLPENHWKTIDIFVLYDLLAESTDESITCEAWSQEGRPLVLVGKWLQAQLQERNLSLQTLCGLSDEDIAQAETLQREDSPEERFVEEHQEEIHQQAMSQLRLEVAGQTLEQEAGTAVQLRDGEIRPAFLAALQEAREQVIIYSPWISEQVMDEDFIVRLEQLVRQGVYILIGHGIERDENRQERPIPPNLLQRLQSIQTTEGTPGIIVEWLGNSHAKELLVDRKMHMSGSQNWLSYRGDRFPRGETVYKVTIAREVEKAYNHLAQRFIERAKTLWSRGTDKERRAALRILSALGQEQKAAEWVQRDRR